MNNIPQRIGILDTPAETDSLGITAYIDALMLFLRRCETPMTLAVQGDWGSGKTSVMNMVARDLEHLESQYPDESIQVVEFNTWQYSQFNLGESLALNLLQRIIDSIPDDGNEKLTVDKIKTLRLISSLLYKVAPGMLRMTSDLVKLATPAPVGTVFDVVAEGVAQQLDKRGDNAATDAPPVPVIVNPVAELEQLRATFAAMVAASGKKLVVFIDDLDRLQPERAVELMEAIKIFLDVKNCVFVLAIDFEVVRRGVLSKYGADFSEEKARAFFDKIIQVPFQLPTGLYQISNLFIAGLESMGLSAEQATPYVQFATASIGSNPRATKRLLNNFSLLKLVHASSSASNDPAVNLDLFAALCLQTAYPKLYEAFVQNGAESPELNELITLAGSDTETGLAEALQEFQVPPAAALHAESLVVLLRDHFSDDGSLSWERFERSLSGAAATSVGVVAAPEGRRPIEHNFSTLSAALTDRPIASEFVAPLQRLDAELGDRFALSGGKSSAWTIWQRSPKKRIGLVEFGKQKLVLRHEFRAADWRWQDVQGFAEQLRERYAHTAFAPRIEAVWPSRDESDNRFRSSVACTWDPGDKIDFQPFIAYMAELRDRMDAKPAGTGVS